MRLPALLALALALAGCIAAPQPEPVAPQGEASTLTPPTEVLEFSDGETFISTLPVVGGEARFDVSIEPGQAWLAQTVKWDTRGTVLEFVATDPDGNEAGESRTLAGSSPRSPARVDWWVANPAGGTWTFTIRGDGSVPLLRERVTMQQHTAQEISGMHVAQQTAVPPGGFAEVNTEMKAGQTMTYAWTAASPVYFNIHTHRDGVTTNVVEETTDAMRATFTAEEDGGYSLLWALDGGQVPLPSGEPVPLTYRVDGQYELHSAVG